jgi:hypothetical protein
MLRRNYAKYAKYNSHKKSQREYAQSPILNKPMSSMSMVPYTILKKIFCN